VGIIGAGGNTKLRHIPNLLEIPGVQLHTVCNRSLGSSCAAAKAFGIPGATDSWRQVIDDPDIDAVVIGTWPYMHATLTCAALAAGKHVLCEARMVGGWAGGRAGGCGPLAVCRLSQKLLGDAGGTRGNQSAAQQLPLNTLPSPPPAPSVPLCAEHERGRGARDAAGI
jgi:hypothetical protein